MKLDIKFLDCVGDISAFVGEGPGTLADDLIVWYFRTHEITLNWQEKTLDFSEDISKKDSHLSDAYPSKKEYFSIIGIASFYSLKFEENAIDYNSGKGDI